MFSRIDLILSGKSLNLVDFVKGGGPSEARSKTFPPPMVPKVPGPVPVFVEDPKGFTGAAPLGCVWPKSVPVGEGFMPNADELGIMMSTGKVL